MVTKKDIEGMYDGQSFETVALIKGYEVRPTKNGSKFIDGTVELKGSVQFKVWAGTLFDEMEKCDYQNTVCKVVGKANDYNGVKSIILTDAKALAEGTYDESDFLEDKYPIDAYWDGFRKLIEKNCSSEAYEVFSKIMEDVDERFRVEFAAKGHHDAVKGGLLAHTYKETVIMTRVMKLYEDIIAKVNPDLLILGCALHDVGKVYEYTNGAILGNGLIVSHHTFGVEILHNRKSLIVEKLGEEAYYRLLSVIEQHHGEFGERPRSLEAYLVHQVDLLESRFQIVNEGLAKDTDVVAIDGYYLK